MRLGGCLAVAAASILSCGRGAEAPADASTDAATDVAWCVFPACNGPLNCPGACPAGDGCNICVCIPTTDSSYIPSDGPYTYTCTGRACSCADAVYCDPVQGNLMGPNVDAGPQAERCPQGKICARVDGGAWTCCTPDAPGSCKL